MQLKEHCTDTLTAHVAVSCGEMNFVTLGGHNNEYIYMVVGGCISELATCIDDAKSKQLVVTPAVADWLGKEIDMDSESSVTTTVMEPSGNIRVDSLQCTQSVRYGKVNRLHRISNAASLIDRLQRYIPATVCNNLATNTFQSNSQLREVTTLFLKLDSFEASRMSECVNKLQQFFLMAQAVLADTGGFMRQFLVDDKGCVLIAMWGVPSFTHANNCSRALQAAGCLMEQTHVMRESCSIGITTGTIYCGSVGASMRRDYVGIGSSVNMSARLMGKAEGRILVDVETHKRLPVGTRRELLAVDPLVLKGIDEPVNAYECLGAVAASFVVTEEAEADDDEVGNAVRPHRGAVKVLRAQLNMLVKAENCDARAREMEEKVAAVTTGVHASPFGDGSSYRNDDNSISFSCTMVLAKQKSASQLQNTLIRTDIAPSATFTIVQGPAGSGKSTCAQHFRRKASFRGLRCVWVRGSRGDEQVSCGVLGKLLTALIGPDALSSESRQKDTLRRLVQLVHPDCKPDEVLRSSRSLVAALGYNWLMSVDPSSNMSPSNGSGGGNFSYTEDCGCDLNNSPIKSQETSPKSVHNRFRSTRSFTERIGSRTRNLPRSKRGGGQSRALPSVGKRENDPNSDSFPEKKMKLNTWLAYGMAMKGGPKGEHSYSSRWQRHQHDPLLSKLLTLLLQQTPTAVVIEDAHHADELSWVEIRRLLDLPVRAAFLLTMHSAPVDDFVGKATTPNSIPRQPSASTGSERRGQMRCSSYASVRAIRCHSRCTSIDMVPLGFPEVRDLLTGALNSEDKREQIRRRIALQRSSSVSSTTNGSFLITAATPSGTASDQSTLVQNFEGFDKTGAVPESKNTSDEPANTRAAGRLSDPALVTPGLVESVVRISKGNAFWCSAIAEFIAERGVNDFLKDVAASSVGTPLNEPFASGRICTSFDMGPESSGLLSRTEFVDTTPGSTRAPFTPLPNRSSRGPLDVLVVCRFEKLSNDLQTVIKHAAVIGHEFTIDHLRAVLPTELVESLNKYVESMLESSFIIVCTGAVRGTGEVEMFEFQNCLMRNAIYDLIPPSDAAKIHEQLADHIEQLSGEDLMLHMGSLCFHYGMCPGRQSDALRCAALAADECLSRGAFRDCLCFVERALGFTETSVDIAEGDFQLVLAVVRRGLAEIAPKGVLSKLLIGFKDISSGVSSWFGAEVDRPDSQWDEEVSSLVPKYKALLEVLESRSQETAQSLSMQILNEQPGLRVRQRAENVLAAAEDKSSPYPGRPMWKSIFDSSWFCGGTVVVPEN